MQSYCIAIDFRSTTSPTTQSIYVDENRLLHCTADSVGVIGGPTHSWTHTGQILGVRDSCSGLENPGFWGKVFRFEGF